ncbi:MAG: hypothetical protein GF364_11495 [Candidatus Lokiarchaeota archaeon]|nr:hypothetical protein [Candidatus Lokiarchaeota archaeon]
MTFIDWANLTNPIYSYKNWAVKDACMEYKDGIFYLFYSAFYRDRFKIKCHVVEVSTKDWLTFSKPIFNLSSKEKGWTGLASPNINKINDKYILTFNSWGNRHSNKRTNNLFYIESEDLIHWSEMRQVARNLTENIRVIDIAVANENNKFYVIWKDRDRKRITKMDRARIAVSHSLDGTFEYIGDGYMKFLLKNGTESSKIHENFEFIKIDGIWYILSTDYRPHRPYLYRISGTGRGVDDNCWLKWTDGYELNIPQEQFNTHDRSNAGFLADWREYDGHYYLLYAGTTEGRSHARRGDSKLGLARSNNLLIWNLP